MMKMRRFALSYITKVYIIVAAILTLSLGAVFAFQYNREHQFRLELLNAQLTLLNHQMMDHYEAGLVSVQLWIRGLDLPLKNLRFSIFDMEGNVIFDNLDPGKHKKGDVLSYPGIKMAMTSPDNLGYAISDVDVADDGTYYYYAVLKDGDVFARTGALSEEVDINDMLTIDKKLIWYAILIYIVVLLLTYFAVSKLGKTIKRLSRFAQRAENGDEIYDVEAFPNDELGKIARNIILLYVRLQRTMAERDRQAQIAMREEQEKAQMKRDLTNNINHELKTPVSAISLELDTLINNYGRLSEEQRTKLITRCRANADRLQNMIQDILTLNRIDEGSSAIQNELLSLTDIVEEVVDNLKLKAKAAGISINVSLPDTMMMRGNASLLESIFANLINNSIAYSGASEISIFLQQEDEKSYRIIICDNGCGIPEEHFEHIFDRFYRLEKGRTRTKGGTGIGLAIVKSAANYHNGSISIRNLPSGGLEFTLILAKQLPTEEQY